MKSKALLFTVLLLLSVTSVLAQGDPTNTVTFNNFSFKVASDFASNVNIVQFAGDPKDAQQPGGPEVPHIEFVLYNDATAPASFEAPTVIRLYKAQDFTGYDFPQQRFDQLKELLDKHPDLNQSMEIKPDNTSENSLPFMPVFGASQAIRARAQYVETAAVKGINYLTVYRQDVSPFTSDEFIYTFQGLSTDGEYYISASFRLTTSLFPKEIPTDFDYDKFTTNFTQYLADSVDKLNNAQPGDFTPELSVFDEIVASFTVVK
jgi:hypothetical protein